MIIGFTGTQKGMTDAQKEKVRSILLMLQPSCCEHGGCIGADEDFHNIFEAVFPEAAIDIRPSDILERRADIDQDRAFFHFPKSPLERNHDIVDAVNRMIACPSGLKETLRSGTWATIRYAVKVGAPIHIVYPDGSVEVHHG